MFSFITLVQGLGLAYAAGLNLYAAVAVTGLAVRFGWVHNVPTTIEPFGNLVVIGVRARAVRHRVRRDARSRRRVGVGNAAQPHSPARRRRSRRGNSLAC